MKRPLKSNQRKKQLNRLHHKITSRRQAHFQQTSTESLKEQAIINQ
ncbi:hypothetical protein AADZ84_01860 [Colwelliaceae bacterium MEBiC 14330]